MEQFGASLGGFAQKVSQAATEPSCDADKRSEGPLVNSHAREGVDLRTRDFPSAEGAALIGLLLSVLRTYCTQTNCLPRPYGRGYLLPALRAWCVMPCPICWLQDFLCKASLDNAKARDRILQTIRGSGAFRRFKHALDDLGLWDEWNSFKSAEIERMAVEWLEDNGIEYSREPDATRAASSAI